MEDDAIATYWMGGLSFARHSSHADYATKQRLAPSALAGLSVCLMALRSGLVLVGLGDSRELAWKACLAQRETLAGEGDRDASISGAPPQRQGKPEEQDHG